MMWRLNHTLARYLMDKPRLYILIQAELRPDLLLPCFRRRNPGMHPTQGFCFLASEASFFLLGGTAKGWQPMVGLDKQGMTHWWLEQFMESSIHPTERVDPTDGQYLDQGQIPPYHTGRPGWFLNQRLNKQHPMGLGIAPSSMAQALLERMFQTQGWCLCPQHVHQLRVLLKI